MREIAVRQIRQCVRDLLAEAVYRLPQDYIEALEQAQDREASETGCSLIGMLLENAQYAEGQQIPTCQDTGMAILQVEVGQEVHFTGGHLHQALEEAVREAYQNLRKSIVGDPFVRENTGDNTPPVVHYEIVPGDKVRITALMKGFGAELKDGDRSSCPDAGRQFDFSPASARHKLSF